jgi:hypothetical protein
MSGAHERKKESLRTGAWINACASFPWNFVLKEQPTKGL